jgi:hypothetical protein
MTVMKPAKRLFALFFLLILGASPALSGLAYGDEDDGLPPVTIVQASNLQTDGQQALKRHVPILLMFAQHGCSWCHYVEESQLTGVFVDASATRLVPNIVGVSNPDFYGGDLDDGLARSEQIIRRRLAALNLN